ncbi:MAG: hypothetical protein K2P79_07365 [Sphingomonas sp.]|nr:hypothetical protein [Sphingomonas sp.]
MSRLLPIALLAAAPLVACGDTGERTPMAMAANADDMPMPDGSKADMATVPLFPGSVVRASAKIMPHEVDDMMHFSFTSPAEPTVVRDWFAETLGRDGYRLRAQGNNLIGTDAGGKPFRLDLAGIPGGKTMGVVSKG